MWEDNDGKGQRIGEGQCYLCLVSLTVTGCSTGFIQFLSSPGLSAVCLPVYRGSIPADLWYQQCSATFILPTASLLQDTILYICPIYGRTKSLFPPPPLLQRHLLDFSRKKCNIDRLCPKTKNIPKQQTFQGLCFVVGLYLLQ